MASGKTDHALERLVFFSDAVFAIAITLLVIEIHPPHLERGASLPVQLEALAELLPNFIGFAVSFAVTGAFWAGHHRAFSLAGTYSPRVIVWNLFFLGAIAFMPFVTAFTSANYGMVFPAACYWAWLIVTALLNLKVNSIATGPEMRAPGVPAEAARDVLRRSAAVLLAALGALALAFAAPRVAAVAMAAIPLWTAALRRMARGTAAR